MPNPNDQSNRYKALDQMQLAALLNGKPTTPSLKTITGNHIDRSGLKDILWDDYLFQQRTDPRERDMKIGMIMDILVNGSQNMSARHVAESVFDIVDRPLSVRDVEAMRRIAARHTERYTFDQTPSRVERDLEEHVAACCVHRCHFGEFECAVTNGTATADMTCEEEH